MTAQLPGFGSAEPTGVRRQWSAQMDVGMVVLPLLECRDEPVRFFAAKAALFSSVRIEACNEQSWLGIEPQAELAEHVQLAEYEVGAESSGDLLQRNVRGSEQGIQPPAVVG